MVKITADSAADLGGLFEQYSIGVMPLYVILDGRSGLDGADVKAADILDLYDEKKILPKTAARSPEQFAEFFRGYTAQGYDVVHFCLSSRMSTTYENAVTAAKAFGNVYVVDSLSLSSAIGILALDGAEMAQSGLPAAEIAARCLEKRKYLHASAIIDTMEFLYKGGRCGKLQNLLATVLRIRPSAVVDRNGDLNVGAKFMGNAEKNVRKYVANTLREFPDPDPKRAFIAHSLADPALVEAAREELMKAAPFEEIHVVEASATITAHVGRGALGILYCQRPT